MTTEPNVEDTAEETVVPLDLRTNKQKKMDQRKADNKQAVGDKKALDAMYKVALDNDAVAQDIHKTTKNFIEYHAQLAKDGVAYKPIAGKPGEMETVDLTDSQRVMHLNKAAAQQEILDYIDRRSS